MTSSIVSDRLAFMSKVFSPEFRASLIKKGFYIQELEKEAAGSKGQIFHTTKRWVEGAYSSTTVNNGIWSDSRDGVVPTIKDSIDEIIAPWRRAAVREWLPQITLKELSRMVGISARRIHRELRDNPPTFVIGGCDLTLVVPYPNFIKRRTSTRSPVSMTLAERNQVYLGTKLTFHTPTSS